MSVSNTYIRVNCYSFSVCFLSSSNFFKIFVSCFLFAKPVYTIIIVFKCLIFLYNYLHFFMKSIKYFVFNCTVLSKAVLTARYCSPVQPLRLYWFINKNKVSFVLDKMFERWFFSSDVVLHLFTFHMWRHEITMCDIYFYSILYFEISVAFSVKLVSVNFG